MIFFFLKRLLTFLVLLYICILPPLMNLVRNLLLKNDCGLRACSVGSNSIFYFLFFVYFMKILVFLLKAQNQVFETHANL